MPMVLPGLSCPASVWSVAADNLGTMKYDGANAEGDVYGSIVGVTVNLF